MCDDHICISITNQDQGLSFEQPQFAKTNYPSKVTIALVSHQVPEGTDAAPESRWMCRAVEVKANSYGKQNLQNLLLLLPSTCSDY